MSRSDLFSSFRSALKAGSFYSVSDDEINGILDGVLTSYKITNDYQNIDQATVKDVAAGIKSIVISKLGLGKAGAYSDDITGVVEQLKGSGFVAVPKNYSQPQATAPQNQTPSTTATSTTSSTIATSASRAVQSFIAPIASSFARPPTRYIRVPYRQTAADKQRLIWIIGGMGLIFAIAIGAIAARD